MKNTIKIYKKNNKDTKEFFEIIGTMIKNYNGDVNIAVNNYPEGEFTTKNGETRKFFKVFIEAYDNDFKLKEVFYLSENLIEYLKKEDVFQSI